MPAPPLKLNFAHNQYIDGYRSLFSTAGRIDMENSLDITRADYKSGYCIFGFNTSFLCHGEPQEREKMELCKRNANITANVIMYMEIDNNIFVNKTRRITKDYEKWTAITPDVYSIKNSISETYLKECLQNVNS